MRRDRLERALTAPLRRRAVLGTIFWAMPKAVTRRALAKERLVVTWRITGRRDGRADLRQLVIEDGAAGVRKGEPREPDLELALDGVAFVLLATGNASPQAMYVRDEIELTGSPWVALRLGRVFRA
jgi:SCP-2 sterol transfer family